MILSSKTRDILKNYASINPGIYIRKGNRLTSLSEGHDFYAEAVVEEEFPVEFAIADLGEFLNTLKLYESPVLDFSQSKNYMYIREKDDLSYKTKYVFFVKEKVTYPDKRPVLNKPVITFNFDKDLLSNLFKASNIMKLSNIVITPDKDGKIEISLTNIKNPSSNTFSQVIDADIRCKFDFKFIFDIKKMKMLPLEYRVDVFEGTVSRFYNDVVEYIMALNIKSVFKG